MPRFGISTKTRIDIYSLHDNSENAEQSSDRWNRKSRDDQLRLSISFDDGFHHIPWLNLHNKHHDILEQITITFIYSGSDGSIHAVHHETKYVPDSMPKSFTVNYIWIEEADVDMEIGVLVMFACIIIFVLLGVLGECSSPESRMRRGKGSESSSLFPPSSSEGFMKKL